MRKLSLLLLACLTLGIAWAERVNVTTAQQVAASVAAGLNPSNLRSSSDIKLVYAAPAQSASGLRATGGESDYYIFNVGTDGGFVIVSGEDRVRPVLGYSDEGSVDMERMPENMKAWLEMYQGEIGWAVSQGLSASDEVRKEWQSYLNGGSKLRMGNVVSLSKPTAQWSQSDPYNRMTPIINGYHAVTGCVATAMAIVMKYYEYPTQAIPGAGVSEYDGISITYDAYDWGNMLNEYERGLYNDQQGDAVAKLMWHCGANVEMDYGVGASGAQTSLVASALKNVYGYSQTVLYEPRVNYSWSEWKQKICREIDADRPVILNGTDPRPVNEGGGGHAFICDGYTTDGAYRINWGWGGSGNGYFLLSTLDDDYDGYGYSTNQGAITGIQIENGSTVVTDSYPILMRMTYSGEGPLVANSIVDLDYFIQNVGDKAARYTVGITVIDNNNLEDFEVPNDVINYVFDENQNGWTSHSQYAHLTLDAALTESQYIAFVYSDDNGATWQVMKTAAGVPIGLGSDGELIIEPDDPNEPPLPINVSINYNHFDKCFFQANYSKQGSMSINIGGTEDIALCYDIVNSKGWFDSGLKMYYSFDDYIYSDNKDEIATEVVPDQDGKIWIDVPEGKIQDGELRYYLRIEMEDEVEPIFAYDLSVCSKDKSEVYATFNANMTMVDRSMNWTYSPSSLKGAVNTDIPFTLTATNVDGAMTGLTAIYFNLTGITPEQGTLYFVNGEERTQVVLEPLNMIFYDGNNEIQMPSSQTRAIFVPDLKEGATYNFVLRSNTELPASEYRRITIANATVDGISVLSDNYPLNFEITAPIEAKPITWNFMSEEDLTFPGDAEGWFYLKATNVPEEYLGQAPTISLNIEGSLSNEVEVYYIVNAVENRRILLEVIVDPDSPTSNLCITTPYALEPLEEGMLYTFALRYKGDIAKLPYGSDIQIESVSVGGVELPFEQNELINYYITVPDIPIEVADGEVLYDESHAGKIVNVYSDGIYVVNEPNASIKDLHIQPGGQVCLLQQLEVGQLYLSHDIPTDKWTTFAVPQSSQNIMIGDGNDMFLAEGGTMAGRKGYTSADDQMWTPQYEASFAPGTAVLLANANGGGLVGFHNGEFYNETLTPMTLPVRPYTEIDGNQPNGTWFHFVANPLWENLQIDGRAYVLDETGKNFALRENPTIKPFEAYMIASDEVMDNVSNLRIGGIPTSNEEMMATGFRAWSESGHICFETTEAKDVAIYSMTGVQLQRIERSVGTKRVALNQGIYIVVCDGTAYKVSVK
mgnify:FL=1